MAIVICRRVFSRPDWLRGALCAVLAAFAAPIWAAFSLAIGNVDHSAFSASDIRLDVGQRTAVLVASRLRLLGRDYSGVRLDCGQFQLQADGFDCASGSLSANGLSEKLPLRFSLRGGALEVDVRPAAGEQWLLKKSGSGDLDVSITAGQTKRLQALLPLPDGWKLSGRIDGRLQVGATSAGGRLVLRDAGFSDVKGIHAAEKLAGEYRLSARRNGEDWQWESEFLWQGGEVYWQPIYAKADGQAFKARGRFSPTQIEISEARLALPGIGEMTGALKWNRHDDALVAARIESAGLDLSKGGSAYLMPILAESGVPETKFGGKISFSMLWDQKGLATVGVGLDDISMRAVDGRFSAAGVRGGLPWQRDNVMEGYLKIDSAKAGGIQLGSFELPIVVEPKKFTINRAEIPVLDSQLVIERLVWRKSSKRQAWEGDLSMSLLPVPLGELTRALGLPAMSGTVSGSFPHFRYREGAAYLDGALVIQVFEGYLNCTHLRLEDPFGTIPRLTANIFANRINLGQLTDTFSFGHITGYAEAEVKDLELAGWKAVKFDAQVMSSSGDYRKRISQRAVQNISSLGGAGAGAAVQATFLRFFEEFGYDKIGLSCKLRGGICIMGGVEDVPAGYVMVKGGGLPSLTVIGYNRHVDWTELVDRLMGIVQNNVKPVIQ